MRTILPSINVAAVVQRKPIVKVQIMNNKSHKLKVKTNCPNFLAVLGMIMYSDSDL